MTSHFGILVVVDSLELEIPECGIYSSVAGTSIYCGFSWKIYEQCYRGNYENTLFTNRVFYNLYVYNYLAFPRRLVESEIMQDCVERKKARL